MKEGGHVVVEVKETRSLRGSNDLTELASRVTQEKGWLPSPHEAVQAGFRWTDTARVRADPVGPGLFAGGEPLGTMTTSGAGGR